MAFWKNALYKTDPKIYETHDRNLNKSLNLRDLLGLGIGMIVSTSIFTLPGTVAAMHTGPAVIIAFILGALITGIIALIYAEMSSAMPFAGSAYSWINVLFGELPGWLVGWALLAEYLIALAFISSGLSANLRPLLHNIGINFPNFLSHPLGVHGGIVDLVALIAILLSAILVAGNVNSATKIDNILVIAKLLAIFLFIIVGAFYLHKSHFIPFLPHYRMTKQGAFGGWQGIYAGLATIFIAYLGFDAITANAAEVKNPQRNLPLGILGSLGIAAFFFILVSIILIGIVPYHQYLNSVEPLGLALRAIHHSNIAFIVQLIAVLGMFTALIGLTMAGSRLIYSFGRDKMLPKWLGKVDQKHRPTNALILSTVIVLIIGSLFPFTFLSQLDTAGTLFAFVMVSLGMFKLRKIEGKTVKESGFKLPCYRLLSILGLIVSLAVFGGIDRTAQLITLIWFIIGLIIYLIYGYRHSERG